MLALVLDLLALMRFFISKPELEARVMKTLDDVAFMSLPKNWKRSSAEALDGWGASLCLSNF